MTAPNDVPDDAISAYLEIFGQRVDITERLEHAFRIGYRQGFKAACSGGQS